MEYNKYEYDEFFGTGTKQKVLEFFREHPRKQISGKEISREIGIPQSSLSRALIDLESLGIIRSKAGGKFKLFEIDSRVLEWLNQIFNLMEQVRLFTMEQRKDEKRLEVENKDWR
jgi:DNA-binding IclR family transcriptional regulator